LESSNMFAMVTGTSATKFLLKRRYDLCRSLHKKTESALMCPGIVGSSCFTGITHRAALVNNPVLSHQYLIN